MESGMTQVDSGVARFVHLFSDDHQKILLLGFMKQQGALRVFSSTLDLLGRFCPPNSCRDRLAIFLN